MKYIGAHVSASGGVENAPLNAHNIGATAFANQSKAAFIASLKLSKSKIY